MKNNKIKLFNIAFKNLFRHRIKSILTILAIIIGVALYIWMDAWLLGMNLDSKRNLVNYETGSAKIYSKAYFEKKDELPMYESFGNYDGILKKLNEAGYNSAPRFVFTGSLMSQESELPFMLIGVNPEMEKKVFKYYKWTEPPAVISKDDFENNILPDIKSDKDKNMLKERYNLEIDLNYHFKEIDPENNSQIIDVKKEIEKLNEKVKDNNLNGKSKFYDKKIEDLNLKYRALKRKILRIYTDEIKNILQSISYNNFIKPGKFEMLIGERGASDLKVKIGDNVRLSVVIDKKDEKGRVRHIHQLIDLKIAGIVNSPNPKTNGNIGYISIDILQDDKGLMLEGQITEICIRKKGVHEEKLPGKDESEEYLNSILKDTLPDNLILVNWEKDAKDYLAMSAQDIVTTYIMVGILFILAIMGIANTMLMAVFERIKEIGMLRSIGMKDFEIIRLFLYEAGFIGLIGSFFGVIIGLVLDYWIIKYGIDYTNILAEGNMQDFGYRVVGIFRGAWNYHTIILSPFVATLVSCITAVIPALKAVKISITDALRFE